MNIESIWNGNAKIRNKHCAKYEISCLNYHWELCVISNVVLIPSQFKYLVLALDIKRGLVNI